MEQPGPNGRHRDKNGEIGRKHGNTLVSTPRTIHGTTLAPDATSDRKLSDVLVEMDETSFSQLVHDHERGRLKDKISAAEMS